MAVIGFSFLWVLVHTRPVGRVPGISFLVLHCLALVLTSGRGGRRATVRATRIQFPSDNDSDSDAGFVCHTCLTDDGGDWNQCDVCDSWHHQDCQPSCDPDNDWICPSCRN